MYCCRRRPIAALGRSRQSRAGRPSENVFSFPSPPPVQSTRAPARRRLLFFLVTPAPEGNRGKPPSYIFRGVPFVFYANNVVAPVVPLPCTPSPVRLYVRMYRSFFFFTTQTFPSNAARDGQIVTKRTKSGGMIVVGYFFVYSTDQLITRAPILGNYLFCNDLIAHQRP